jgi:type IV pilus assembly protein PilO
MNVLEELRALDVNEPGRWPLPFRAAAVFIILVIVTALGIWRFVIRTEIPELEAKEQQEQELRASFENKQSLAANFDAYRDQLDAIERDFGTMLRKLPGETEVENLLEDISQTALGAGLEEKLFNPQAEVRKDFYAELPITVRYVVAALPRIVTLHDIRITPISVEGDQEQLQLDATAKTYRYLEEESPE